MPIVIKTIAALLASIALQAQALQITSLSPQGEVALIRQIPKFDESATNFGDPKAPTPLSLNCSNAQATKGTERWISDHEWAFEFENDLPLGVNCSLQVRSGIKSASGSMFLGASSYKFSSGGPLSKACGRAVMSGLTKSSIFCFSSMVQPHSKAFKTTSGAALRAWASVFPSN